MELEQIKDELELYLQNIKDEITTLLRLPKAPKINKGEYVLRVLSKLKTIVGNPIKNPIMTYGEAENYYVYGDNALENLQQRYILILELQDYITSTTTLPFIYDKFTILKLLQLNNKDYNSFINDAEYSWKTAGNLEHIANIFLDIDAMLLNDRMLGAENGTHNAKAIDIGNRYKRGTGGFGVKFEESESNNSGNSKSYIDVTPEEAQKKLANQFGFITTEEPKKK